MINLAPLVPLLPLLGGLIAFVGGRRLKGHAHWPVVAGIALAFVVSLGLLFNARVSNPPVLVYHWIDVGDLHVPFELRVDGLTTMMLSMVTFVATLIAIFASGYMAGDPGYPRFFFLIGLFVFSMTGLILSNNYVLTYAFWEGVGVCSYLLVGFWHEKPAASAAAQKAFMVNRVGDVGFAIALFWMWTVFGGSLSYTDVLDHTRIEAIPEATRLGIVLLLFWAATAKSAQIPLYVWLPDAMEGPTPVSALIHAATMVTAGVYLIARSSLLVVTAPTAQIIIASIGCATALLSSLIALTQTDLKRVMAYSTVSQLGYMFMGLGAGIGSAARLAVVAGLFHLFTHAFFKALLFLSSGSVMHAMGGVIDMRRFRGLRHRLPYTHITFACGGLALSGIFPFAGFWSKDEILAALSSAARYAGETSSHVPGWWSSLYWLIWATAIGTAGLTAFYTGRAYFLTFWGPERLPSPDDPEADKSEAHSHGSADAAHAGHDDHGHGHGGHDSHFGHESPPVMWVPLMVLAACALLVGIIFGPTKLFEHHIIERTPGFAEALHHHEHSTDWASMLLGTACGLIGLGLAYVMYAAPSAAPGRLASSLKPLYELSYQKFRIDEFYDATVIRFTRGLAAVSKFLDVYLIDNLVRLTAWIPRMVGRDLLGPLQNGLVQYYVAVTAMSVAALLVYLMLG